MLRRELGQQYSPLFFLAALGAGGLGISFFMYLMFLVPHKGVPMAALQHWLPLVQQGGMASVGILAVLALFVGLAVLHFALLAWNIGEYRRFKQTEAYTALRASNAEVTLMAIPLTIAMSVNVLFVASSLFVPGLWSIVEYLFPFSLAAFSLIGVYALYLYGRYLVRLVIEGDFDESKNTNLGQLLAPFAFSMVAVGLAAPGAMSHHTVISGLGLGLSMLFVGLTLLLTVVFLLKGLRQMKTRGLDLGGAPTLWVLIPILTLLGITFVRQTMGAHHHFGAPLDASNFLQVMSLVLGFQLVIGAFGWAVMKKMGYFARFVHGEQHSPASFSLICPGVALAVFGFFFLNYAFIMNGVIAKYSLAHWALLLPLALLQLVTARTMFKLLRRQVLAPQLAPATA